MYTSVLIVDKSIEDPGVLTNVGLVIGLTAGRYLPESTFGHNITDGDGQLHRYLTNMVQVVRKAGQNKLRHLRAYFASLPDTLVVDFTEDAAVSTYDEYERGLTAHSGEAISYRAIYVYGPYDEVYAKTKNLSTLFTSRS